MNLNDLKKNWNQFGEEDPYWAILTDPNKKNNKWTDEEFFRAGETQIDRILRSVKRLAPSVRFDAALDFGCGAGRLTQGIASHFSKVIGVDIAPSMIQLAKEKNKKENCTFLVNDKTDLSVFGDDKFDFVCSIITLQHMKPAYSKNYIKEFFRVLKKGGVLVFQIPSRPINETFKSRLASNSIVASVLKMKQPKAQKDAPPEMEMYGLPIEKMINLIVGNKGRVLKIQSDNHAGDTWSSYTYIVSKTL